MLQILFQQEMHCLSEEVQKKWSHEFAEEAALALMT